MRPPRYYPESDGGDVDGRKYPRTFYVVDREGTGRHDCKSLAEAEELATLMNLDPEVWASLLREIWPDEIVVEALIEKMADVTRKILTTDTDSRDARYRKARATDIVSDVALVSLYCDEFCRRTLGPMFPSILEQRRYGVTIANRRHLWKAWKGVKRA